jgi:hypothetical protein
MKLSQGITDTIALVYLANAHRHLMETTKEFDINVVEAEEILDRAFLSVHRDLGLQSFSLHPWYAVDWDIDLN